MCSKHGYRDCWLKSSDDGTKPWLVTVPIILCPDNNISNCPTVIGVLEMNVLWINDNQTPTQKVGDGEYPDIRSGNRSVIDYPGQCNPDGTPRTMAGIKDADGNFIYGNWTPTTCSDPVKSWKEFRDWFKLRNMSNTTPDFKKMAMYFLPECKIYSAEPETQAEHLLM